VSQGDFNDEELEDDFVEGVLPKGVAQRDTTSDCFSHQTPQSDSKEPRPGPDNVVRVADIKVDRAKRQRKKLDAKKIDGLADSIRRRGLIHALTITRDKWLVAGECRLAAVRQLGWEWVRIEYTDELDPVERKLIELEENVKRVDISGEEIYLAHFEIWETYRQKYPNATQAEVAERYGISEPTLSNAILYSKVKNDPIVATAENIDTGLKRHREKKKNDAEAEAERKITKRLGDVPPEQLIRNENFLEWAPGYKGPRFNLVHCDLPYGINAHKSGQGSAAGRFDDVEEIYWTLIDCLNANIDHIATPSAHLIFWFAMKHYERTKAELTKGGWIIDDNPLSWYRIDAEGEVSNDGILPAHLYGFRRIYETAFFGRRGNRQVVKAGVPNAIAAPGANTLLFPTVKPVPVLTHFFKALIDPDNASVFDPTCGSGTALIAAEALGAKHVLGLEKDTETAENACTQLLLARKARREKAWQEELQEDPETIDELMSKRAAE
jgi:ParB-like chromosome segregation protein Spo0J